jgi:hypothetical protein
LHEFAAPDRPLSECELIVLRKIRDEWCAANNVPGHVGDATQALMDLIAWHKFGIRSLTHLRAMLDAK